jgi:hypothetical protein
MATEEDALLRSVRLVLRSVRMALMLLSFVEVNVGWQ